MKRILLLTSSDPRKSGCGTQQRSNFVWTALKSLGEVYTVICVHKASDEFLDGQNNVAGVCFESSSWFVRKIRYLFAGFTKVGSLPVRSRAFIRSKIGWPEVDFDFVVARYVNTVSLTAAWQIAPCFVDVDDLPSEAFESTCRRRLPFGFRCAAGWVVRAWERYVLRHCKGAWVANPEQHSYVRRFTTCGILKNIARGPDEGYPISGLQHDMLMTVGLMGYGPNAAGVDWFLTTVWPIVHERFPTLEYVVAGGGLPKRYQVKWSEVPGVKVLGFVNDLDSLYAQALAVVAPIRSGAGTCIKVQEACLRGRKTFGTPFAFRGISGDGIRDCALEQFCDAETFCSELKNWMETALPDREKMQLEMQKNAKYRNDFSMFKNSIEKILSL